MKKLYLVILSLFFFQVSVRAQTPTPDYVKKFAPILSFTNGANGYGFPMSAQPFWAKWTANGTNFSGIDAQAFGVFENIDENTLGNGSIPTYYQVKKFGNQIRINYWWFYGYQHPCIWSEGSHQGDWEHVMVILKTDLSAVAAVTYYQHDGHYTRIAGPRAAPCTPAGTGRCIGAHGFPIVGLRPKVYVGRTAHGSYHDTSAGVEGPGTCAYYGDARGDGPKLDSARNLIDLDGSAEPWIASDRANDFTWGPSGVSTHPSRKPPVSNMRACEGSPTYAIKSAGCYKSECLAGDDEASEDCLKECKQGYVNVGLTCNKGKWPWEWSIYGRLNSGNKYSYPYTLPTNDLGLVNRRSQPAEWSIP